LSVSVPPDLAEDLDAMVAERGLQSRSQAVTDMVRQELVRYRAAHGVATLAGTITVVYRNVGTNVRTRITQIQAEYLREVITSQHVFLEDEHGLEVLLVQGPAKRLRTLRDQLLACRGVEQAELAFTAALLPPLHRLPRRRGQ
jgi:CopG family nickel-responsive transcriptional regulator